MRARGAITDVAGLRVGHAQDHDARTGCTVVLGPFRAAVDVRGAATGTRELATASHRHLVDRIDAILLTGGSAFGLAAADGVMAWLEERDGYGYDTGAARVPIVPAAVIFDLATGSATRRPDAAMGRAACEAAALDVAEGAVGAGTGATVGLGRGPGSPMAGGVGTASATGSGYTVGALAVVNALGDVLDAHGRIIAGARGPDGAFLNSARLAREAAAGPEAGDDASGSSGRSALGAPFPGTNTTLCVVATDAPLDRSALEAVARGGSAGQARRIAPAHTPFDGDVTFAVSTAETPAPAPPALVLALSALAADAVAEAIERAVRAANPDATDTTSGAHGVDP